jgi:hypothetical protein
MGQANLQLVIGSRPADRIALWFRHHSDRLAPPMPHFRMVSVLGRRTEHERFGGSDHVRTHVLTQLRLAGGALAD